MKTAGGPLALSFPLLPSAPRRVRPGGAVDPSARGIVFTDLPADMTHLTLNGMEVTPDADGFVPISGSSTFNFQIHRPTGAAVFYGRFLVSQPRVVSFNDLPFTEVTGATNNANFARLELVGLPPEARVQVEIPDPGINVPAEPIIENGLVIGYLGMPSTLPNAAVRGQWNADRTIFSLWVNRYAPREVIVSLPDASKLPPWRVVYRATFTLEPGEIKDVILSYLRAPTSSRAPDGSSAPSSSGQPSPTGPAATPPVGTPGVTAPAGSALLVLSVQPVGAVVSINGTPIRDPSRPVTLAPGPYRLDVSAQGYEKHSETFVATADRTTRLAVNLTAVPVKKGWSRGQIALAAAGGVAVLGGLGAVVVYLAHRPSAPAPAPSLPAAPASQALPPDGRSNPRRGAAAREEEPADDEAERKPSQEDIDESIHVVERNNLRFTRSRMVGGEAREQDYTADGVVAYYLRKEIARAPSRATLFKKLDELALSLGSPSIVSVNDHGNVTAYSYRGKVLNEWV
jgi:hypothetical protein